jgi:hypothetical protein
MRRAAEAAAIANLRNRLSIAAEVPGIVRCRGRAVVDTCNRCGGDLFGDADETVEDAFEDWVHGYVSEGELSLLFEDLLRDTQVVIAHFHGVDVITLPA